MHPLDAHFRDQLAAMRPELVEGPLRQAQDRASTGSGRIEEWGWRLFEAQATSRHLDFVARRLQGEGRGFYTIGSAGHEGNALVAMATRPTDPALLHYRSGAFYVARAEQVPGSTPVRDVLQGLMALADEPIAGGRHKVFGHPDLGIIPQTSTIASHLPRSVGLALALHRAYRLGVSCPWPEDAVVVCSFGDASVNHSTAAGAINTALNASYRALPAPILFVCEDNGWGISVPTAAGWVEAAYGSRPGLDYVVADGSDPIAARTVVEEAVQRVRGTRRPVFLHLRTVRFLGHAGSDAEMAYRRARDIEADYDRDPLLATARVLAGVGVEPDAILVRYEEIRSEIDAETERLRDAPRLQDAAEVMAPLMRSGPVEALRPEPFDRLRAGSLEGPGHSADPMTLAESINATLDQILSLDQRVIVFGEDVGVKGGVYGVTGGLARRHGAARVFDTVLDEQSILGLGLGAGLAGLVPVPEIQYLAYLHNAEDQIRGEGATLPFFSRGAFRNPMVVRVAGLAYQKGFGGHFHNDNAVGVLRDIPGLVVACPARADDAAALLRSCVAAAVSDGTVSVFLEPIALYHRRDLYADGDRTWLAADAGEPVPIGRARVYPTERPQLTLITFGNGVLMSLRVTRRLAEVGIAAEVLDLRWLAPLPMSDVLVAVQRSGRALVVDETRRTGGVGEGVVAGLAEAGFGGPIRRVASEDSFIPLGPAAGHVLLSEEQIEKAALELTGTPALRGSKGSSPLLEGKERP